MLDTSKESRLALLDSTDTITALDLIYGGGPQCPHEFASGSYIPVFEILDRAFHDGIDVRTHWFDNLSAATEFIIQNNRTLAEEDGPQVRHLGVCGCTFGNKVNKNRNRTASTDNIVQLHAFCIDHDKDPSASVSKLHSALQPTFSVHSGGFVDGVPKQHDWYVYTQPLTTAEEFGKHKALVKRLIEWCGSGDPTLSSPVHPVRCPGGLHRKAETQPVRIIAKSGQTITPEQLAEAVNRVAPEAPKQARKTPREKEDARAEWRQSILDGVEVHACLNKLAMSLSHDGRSYEEMDVDLNGLMDQCPWKETEPERWQARVNDIPRIIESALEKVEGSESFTTQEERRAKIALMRDPVKLEELRGKIDERIEVLKDQKAVPDAVITGIIDDIGYLRLDKLGQALYADKIAGALKKKREASTFKGAIKKATDTARKMWNDANRSGATQGTAVLDGYDGPIDTTWNADVQAAALVSTVKQRNLEQQVLFQGPESWVRIKDGMTLEPCKTTAHVRNVLTRQLKITAHDGSHLPEKLVTTFMGEINMELPVCARVLAVPVFGRDGTLQTEKGYVPELEAWLEPIEIPDVPDVVTRDHLNSAMFWIREAVRDFPFSDAFDGGETLPVYADECDADKYRLPNYQRGQSSRAHFLCAFLQPFMMDMINDIAPLFHIDKHDHNIGASYLTDVIKTTFLGRAVQQSMEHIKDGEGEKRITANVVAGVPIISYDNINDKVASAALASAMTARWITQRLLGRSINVTVRNLFTWLMTGCNVNFSAEVLRRIAPILLDAGEPDPGGRQKRGEIKHDLKVWLEEKRTTLIWSALIVIKYAVQNGLLEKAKTYAGPKLDSFERWSAVMGTLLEIIEVPGFLANIEAFRALKSEDADANDDLLAAIWQAMAPAQQGRSQEISFTASQAYEAALKPTAFTFTLPDIEADPEKAEERKSRRIHWLGRKLGKQLGARKITIGDAQLSVRLSRPGKGNSAPWKMCVESSQEAPRATS